MTSNKFLNIFKLFKNFAKRFKTNIDPTEKNLKDLLTAIENNNSDKAHQAYADYLDNSRINSIIPTIIGNGNLNLFLNLAETIPKDKQNQFSFYQKSFTSSVYHDNDKVFKHIFENKHLTLDDINRDNLLNFLSEKNAYKIASYLLYDLKFEINEKIMKNLFFDEKGKKHFQMLEFIEKRDLYFELGEKLENILPKEKTNKI